MSQPPRVPDTIPLLNQRADRYVARARALVDSPGLTTAQAANALDHLADLQGDLARARRALSRDARLALAEAEGRLAKREVALKAAREALSHALLGAAPSEGAAFGRVPHGPLPHGRGQAAEREDCSGVDGAAGGSRGARVRAVSACRALLDLEALRPYLDDEALRRAIDEHARATERCDLRGVAYATLPASAHLPCPVR